MVTSRERFRLRKHSRAERQRVIQAIRAPVEPK
jgi:hypothetical protein